MDITEQLMQFSLTRQEAQIYIALHVWGALTGYEAAKHSGISRSNCYTALASLVEKGAAVVCEDTAVRYLAVAAEEFCENKIRALIRTKERLCAGIPKSQEETQGYITIGGLPHILDKAVNMILSARERIYISLSGPCLDDILPCLKQAADSGLKVVVITDRPPPMPNIVFYRARSCEQQLRLIVDSSAVLTGDTTRDGSCLYSKKHNLVELFKQALKNEIHLIEQNAMSGGA